MDAVPDRKSNRRSVHPQVPGGIRVRPRKTVCRPPALIAAIDITGPQAIYCRYGEEGRFILSFKPETVYRSGRCTVKELQETLFFSFALKLTDENKIGEIKQESDE